MRLTAPEYPPNTPVGSPGEPAAGASGKSDGTARKFAPDADRRVIAATKPEAGDAACIEAVTHSPLLSTECISNCTAGFAIALTIFLCSFNCLFGPIFQLMRKTI